MIKNALWSLAAGNMWVERERILAPELGSDSGLLLLSDISLSLSFLTVKLTS